MRTYTWALGAKDAAAKYGLDTPFGPPVVTERYQDIYPGLGEPEDFERTPGDILVVEQLVGLAGEGRPRGSLRYLDVGPADGWDGWSLIPFEEVLA